MPKTAAVHEFKLIAGGHVQREVDEEGNTCSVQYKVGDTVYSKDRLDERFGSDKFQLKQTDAKSEHTVPVGTGKVMKFKVPEDPQRRSTQEEVTGTVTEKPPENQASPARKEELKTGQTASVKKP